MKTNYNKQIYVNNCLRQRGRIITCVLVVYFIYGIYVITSLVPIYKTQSIDRDPENVITDSINDEYDYYFRIEYTIVQGVCQPLDMFNTTETINSLQKMTNQRINEILSENVTIHLQVFKVNAILENFEKMNQNFYFIKWRKLVCNYILELFVGITFPFYCDNECQSTELYYLTSDTNPFGYLSDLTLKFVVSDTNSIESPTEYSIQNVVLYQTLKYLEKAVFIQSIVDKDYISISLFDSNTFQIPVSLSKTNKSLFMIKKGLDFSDASSIYASFVSLIPPDFYLRHQNGRIIIAKNDQTILFRQDATFKLIFDHQNDLLVFQLINLPDYFYLTLDNQQNPTLILTKYQKQTTVDKFDKRFIFKIIHPR